MSERSKPYANIKQITAHLTIRSIRHFGLFIAMMLVGEDVHRRKVYGKIFLSQPGGEMELWETNPFFAAIREALEELGNHLFFVLTNRMPQMSYTCHETRVALSIDDPRHPGHPDYMGHPVTLRFNFEVLETTGNDPVENDSAEINNLRYEYINRQVEEDKRPCFWQVLQGLEVFMPPTEIRYLSPDFDAMFNHMVGSTMNIHPGACYTWTDHHGTLPYQEVQPFDELLQRLEQSEQQEQLSAPTPNGYTAST